jgi:hypothetical protein
MVLELFVQWGVLADDVALQLVGKSLHIGAMVFSLMGQ